MTSSVEWQCEDAEAVWQAGADEADEDMNAAEDAAYNDYEAVAGPARNTWSTAEQVAWNDLVAAKTLAKSIFDTDAEPALSDYWNSIAALEADLEDEVAAIIDDFNSDVAAALTVWQTNEGNAWTTYETDMAELPGTPALGARVPAPPQFALAMFQAQQPVRPFGGGLQLRNGQLVIPNQYERENDARDRTVVQRVRDQLTNLRDRLRVLGANSAGVLNGDIFDRNAFEHFNNLRATQNEVLITINGILTNQQDAQAMLNSIATFGANIPRVAVVNGTHGLGDFAQIVQNELGRETIADLRAAAQIEIAAQALRNNGGQGEKRIYVVAHSQGTEVFFRALNFLSAETKAMIVFYGVGGQRLVPSDIGLRQSVNYYFSDDGVPRLGNLTPLRLPYATAHQYVVYRLPAAPGGSGHAWVNNYATLFSMLGTINRPGSREISYGGQFPFRELRRNRD